MSDQTVVAEALISAAARAFLEDEAVCIIDVLLRDKYLRDDDMGPRLSLPAKQLRRMLQFLQEQQLVKFELVDDLSSGGSQATKFWYIDYNHAVNVIRFRLFLLKKKLEQAELRARSSSMYLCPGYRTKACNGRYTETEAQQVVDHETGLFLCQECVNAHSANPDPPPKHTYTLQLLDNTKDLRLAMDNMRRVNVQLSGKRIGNQQLRPGIYDLLQNVRSKGSGPLTSNMPGENFSMGIGSKRLAGTGRTANIKAKKLAQQGVVTGGSGAVRKYLGGATRTEEGSDLTFLKNAMGQEIAFEVEKGGGQRANLLATRKGGWRRGKLMDAAASRVGTREDAAARLDRIEREKAKEGDGKEKAKRKAQCESLYFLKNSIGRKDFEEEEERRKRLKQEEKEGEDEEEEGEEEEGLLLDAAEEFRGMSEEERRAAFQSQYRIEMARQIDILRQTGNDVFVEGAHGPPRAVSDEEDDITGWEDG
mmetsp:Transcript_13937/g.40775  ORF Transcript_13937/g.40775 Transcript_13937/m.40775 type:complete len:478 (-) Transcript_13937:100-1533(-)|eukprot:CAMPEP_0113548184 /NCGR_PEP_ID=MMETSP0015_2-20120614/12757_1 /TAXON_ID=2838 /ORGANISM="Odontella" /LENGTH=477 /DNA_ID=CAMNT_0000448795 /DNA_START=89 /DNA_END=1522 /DNA_ORIENTATION=- /assembly_acc=CAM_ASM_000160